MADPNEDPAITAVCNLIAGLGTAMMTSGQAVQFKSLLSICDEMNKATIPEGPALDALLLATRLQRDVLAQLGQ